MVRGGSGDVSSWTPTRLVYNVDRSDREYLFILKIKKKKKKKRGRRKMVQDVLDFFLFKWSRVKNWSIFIFVVHQVLGLIR